MPKYQRQPFMPQFKALVILEALSGLRSRAEVAWLHQLKPEPQASWVRG